MRIFTLLLFCLPFSIFAQNQAEIVWQKTSQKLKTTEPFKVKIKYNYKTWDKADDKSGILNAYFHVVDTFYNGYLKYQYLIQDDTASWYKGEKYTYIAEVEKRHYYHDYDYKDWETIENPLIEGLVKLNDIDKIYLDSNENFYLLYAELENKNAVLNYPNALKIEYTYTINKNDFSLVKVSKKIETNEGELNSTLSFETEFISKRKFDRKLRKNLHSSGILMGMELFESSMEKIKPKLNKDSIPASIPAFSVETLDGKMISNTDNQKLLLLDFWFVASRESQKAMPYYQWFYEKYKNQGLVVLGLNYYNKDISFIQSTLHKKSITYPISLEAAMLVSELKVTNFPTLFLVNSKGEIITAEIGFDEKKMIELEKIIVKELSK